MPEVSKTVGNGAAGTMDVTQLSLYDNPELSTEWEYVPERTDTAPLRSQVRVVREACQTGAAYMNGVYEVTRDASRKCYGRLTQSIHSIQSHPSMLPRAATISLTALTGLVAARRGGILRKVTYSSVGGALGTCLCFPNETVALSHTLWDTVTGGSGGAGTSHRVAQQGEIKSEEQSASTVQDKPLSASTATTPPLQQDKKRLVESPGQGSDKDTDLYTKHEH